MASYGKLILFLIVCRVFSCSLAFAGEHVKQVVCREVEWEELVPTSWRPEEIFDKLDLGRFSDNDPRANKALEAFNEAWRNAPANQALQGQCIKIPGFVVPLDWENDAQLKEFLLVPYFGACIHVPPPPANQIIYIKTDSPLKGIRSMDAVWVYGSVTVERNDSGYMGTSSYSMTPDKVEIYKK